MVIGSIEMVFYTAIFLLPGFIISSIIDKTNPPQRYREGIFMLRCLGWSIANCALLSWAYILIFQKGVLNSYKYWLLLVLITVVGALLVALLVAFIKQKNVIERILDRFGVDTIHSIPTAWDYVFSKRTSGFLVVTLTSGQTIRGYYSSDSFTSSEFDERDIYLEQIYNENWQKALDIEGVYIASSQIRTIQFVKNQEDNNEQEEREGRAGNKEN